MILVSLGTQDRDFSRLLNAVEKQIRLGNIKEKVIVQAGVTQYSSDVMEIFDLIPSEEFSKLLRECRILITHGGVGTIIEGLKHHKKIIAAARLSEFGEHQNNHQKQILSEFTKRHYLLELEDFDALDEKLEEIQSFEPLEYESNTTHFISLLDSYITRELKDGAGDGRRKFMLYLFYGLFTVGLEFFFLSFLSFFSLGALMSLCWFQVFLIGFRFFLHHHFFSELSKNVKDEFFFVLVLTLQVLFVHFFSSFFEFYFIWKLCGISLLSVFVLFFLSRWFSES